MDWSICVHGPDGAVLASRDPDRQLRTASIGKLILLAEIARRIELDPAYGDRRLSRRQVAPIADSGLLQHLSVDQLSVDDLAVLVGAVSDNWATNILLDDVGLPAVSETRRRLGLEQTRLLDQVRRPRTADDAETLSLGSARELCDLMAALQRGELLTRAVAGTMSRWLAAGVDLSMVASAFAFDPLSHAEDDRGLRVVNKTGTDDGIRADVGYVEGPAGHAAYAVIANWPTDGPDQRDAVLKEMRAIGRNLRVAVG